VENIFENSDFVLMLNQAQGDRAILAKQLNISPAADEVCNPHRSRRGTYLLWECGASLCRPFPERYRALPHYDDEAGGSEQPMKQLKPRDKITQKMTCVIAVGMPPHFLKRFQISTL